MNRVILKLKNGNIYKGKRILYDGCGQVGIEYDNGGHQWFLKQDMDSTYEPPDAVKEKMKELNAIFAAFIDL